MTQDNKPDNWFQTYTGRVWHVYDPRPEDVCLEDVAHALAYQTRFNGHARIFYSVAQHCVLASRMMWGRSASGTRRYEAALAGLLHDAAEAYVGDVVAPIRFGPVGPEFAKLEAATMAVVFEAFGLPEEAWERHRSMVRTVDLSLLACERRDLMAPCSRPWRSLDGVVPALDLITPWSPQVAEDAFRSTYSELMSGYREAQFAYTPREETA